MVFRPWLYPRKIDIALKCAWTMLHKIRKAMKARDAECQLMGLVQVDDAFFSGGVKKGGGKRGRGTSKIPVLVMAATRNEAITSARMEVLENVDGIHIKDVLERGVTETQAIKTDGLAAFNVIKELGHEHIPVVVYPKDGEPNYDAFKWVNGLVSNAKRFFSAPTMTSGESISRNTSMSSATASIAFLAGPRL